MTSSTRQVGGLRGHWLAPHARTVSAGTAIVGGSNTVAAIALFAISVAIGRLGGASELGRYGLLVVVGAFFGGIIDFGTDRVITQRLAQRAATWRAAMASVVVVKGAAFAAGLIAALVYLDVAGQPYGLLILVQATSVSAMLTAQALAASLQRLGHYAVIRLLFRVLAVVAVFFMISIPEYRLQLVSYSIALIAAGDLATVAVLALAVFRGELARVKGDPVRHQDVSRAVRDAFPLGLSSLAVWVYLKLDTILLAALAGLPTVGVYTAAVRIAELLGGVPAALNPVLLTLLARLWARDEEDFRIARDAVLLVTTFLMALVCLAMFVTAPAILNVTYHLPVATPYLRILIWGQVFATAGVVCNAALQVSHQGKAVAQIAIAVAVMSVPTYAILIPAAGPTGAAAATAALYAAIVPIGLVIGPARETFRSLLLCSSAAAAATVPAVIVNLAISASHNEFAGARWWAPFAVFFVLGAIGVWIVFRRLATSHTGPATDNADVSAALSS